MLSDAILVGFTMLLCAILEASVSFFKTDTGLLWIKVIVFFVVGGFSVLNGVLFGTDVLTKTIIMGYLSTGLTLGAIASGIYSIGDAAITANKTTSVKRKLKKEMKIYYDNIK
jgi:hypothetical protein